MSIEVRFWGVRGSIPCSGKEYEKFGGHTSCVSVKSSEQLVVLDAGTGLRDLGNWILKENIQKATLCLSHVHLDHIIGLPFFEPLWRSDFELEICSAPLEGLSNMEIFLKEKLFKSPYFPVPFEHLKAHVSFHSLEWWKQIDLAPGLRLMALPLLHPGGSIGYYLEIEGRRLCYLTDTEPLTLSPLKENLFPFLEGADLLICDGTFTEEEFQKKKGWGHSPWKESVQLAEEGGASRCVLFHHAPEHKDDLLEKIQQEVSQYSCKTYVAYEGLILRL